MMNNSTINIIENDDNVPVRRIAYHEDDSSEEGPQQEEYQLNHDLDAYLDGFEKNFEDADTDGEDDHNTRGSEERAPQVRRRPIKTLMRCLQNHYEKLKKKEFEHKKSKVFIIKK